MGKWSKSLPMPLANHTDRAANALYFIGMSMMDSFPERNQVANVRRAAAEVRAWRKKFKGVEMTTAMRPNQRVGLNVQFLLRGAAVRVCWAGNNEAIGLKRTAAADLYEANAWLREAARLLEREVKE